jgi:hypothetical protein
MPALNELESDGNILQQGLIALELIKQHKPKLDTREYAVEYVKWSGPPIQLMLASTTFSAWLVRQVAEAWECEPETVIAQMEWRLRDICNPRRHDDDWIDDDDIVDSAFDGIVSHLSLVPRDDDTTGDAA